MTTTLSYEIQDPHLCEWEVEMYDAHEVISREASITGGPLSEAVEAAVADLRASGTVASSLASARLLEAYSAAVDALDDLLTAWEEAFPPPPPSEEDPF